MNNTTNTFNTLTFEELKTVFGGGEREITTKEAIYGSLGTIGAMGFCYYVVDPFINKFFK